MKHANQPMIIALSKQNIGLRLRIGISLLLLIFLLLFYSFSNKPVFAKPRATDAWVLDKIVSNVEFYHMIGDCDGKKKVFLKFSNKNNCKVKISWKESFDTQLEKHAKGFAGQKQIVLAKGEFVQGGCKTSNFKEVVIQPEQITPTYPAEVRAFEFVDIKVTRLQ